MATKKQTQPASGVWVVAAHGGMLHLHTNVWFTKEPKKVEVDDFLQAQLDAGKLVVVDEPVAVEAPAVSEE